MRTLALPVLIGVLALSACANPGALRAGSDAAAGCATLNAAIDASKIGLPSGGATIESATLMAPSALSVAERGQTPAATITPEHSSPGRSSSALSVG